MPDRDAIIGKLEKERAQLVERYRSMSEDDLARQCTESEVADGAAWSAKDHLAHLASIERAFQGMIRRTLAGEENPVGLPGTDREEILAGVHRRNEENVDEHRSDDLDTLLSDLGAARRDTLTLLGEMSDEQLAQPVPGAPWADGTIGGVLITNAYHEVQHLTWVEAGLNSPDQ